MLARLRKTDGEGGFTLIELLVVMIIIGVLAAVAIPVFLSQRSKAQDSAAKADVSTVGKEIATYFIDNDAVPTVDTTTAAGRYTLISADALTPGIDLGKVSDNVVINNQINTNSTTWCFSVTNPDGDKAVDGYRYSSTGGLEEGICA